MGKIASDLDEALARRAESGERGRTVGHLLAQGDGWQVADVLCTRGPADRPFEERNAETVIGAVLSGSFAHRSKWGRALMTPGSWMLGNPGETFECSHAHAEGDRCVAFHYAPDYFDRVAADAGAPRNARAFRTSRVPPVREVSALVARAAAGVTAPDNARWEELALDVASMAIRVAGEVTLSEQAGTPASSLALVTESVRTIELRPGAPWTLARLAGDAGQSPFHYLRTFRRITGVTPHQFILRARLREAAARLREDQEKIIEIALGSGFGDVSNFNRAFRTEFGVAPRAYRRTRACTRTTGESATAI